MKTRLTVSKARCRVSECYTYNDGTGSHTLSVSLSLRDYEFHNCWRYDKNQREQRRECNVLCASFRERVCAEIKIRFCNSQRSLPLYRTNSSSISPSPHHPFTTNKCEIYSCAVNANGNTFY